MKRLVYISGPINAPNVHQIYANLRRFFRAEAHLLRMGYAPINPAADFFALMMMPNDADETHWTEALMEKDEPMVKRSDALLLLPGWQHSKGALREKAWAEEAGVPVVHSYNELADLFGP